MHCFLSILYALYVFKSFRICTQCFLQAVLMYNDRHIHLERRRQIQVAFRLVHMYLQPQHSTNMYMYSLLGAMMVYVEENPEKS